MKTIDEYPEKSKLLAAIERTSTLQNDAKAVAEKAKQQFLADNNYAEAYKDLQEKHAAFQAWRKSKC